MSEPSQTFLPKEQLLEGYESGASVLEAEAPLIRGATHLLSALSSDPSDEVILPLAAEAATDEHLATNAVDILPIIQKAVEPFTPRQTDPNASATQRWTMNWKEIGGRLSARLAERPRAGKQLGEWFMQAGNAMVETTYGSEPQRPLMVVIAGANDQCSYRPILTLASLASPEFRQANGLATVAEHTLSGEDGRQAGWLKDDAFVATLREHVLARIEAEEIHPRFLVVGSAAEGRVLRNEKEVNTVRKYLDPALGLLYPERGLTEADAMLAGAIKVFGGDISSVEIVDIPSDSSDTMPNKSVSFDSTLGRIEFIATTGNDANLLRQVVIAGQQKPELFERRDAIQGATTAIYTWVQRPAMREATTLLGLKDLQVEVLGTSAHAAGLDRKPETLIGELTNYLKAMYDTAVRTLENAELNAQVDIEALGGTAITGAQTS